MFYLSAASLRNSEGIEEGMIEVRNVALKISLVDFGHAPHSGLRTVETQHEMYLDGKSKADGINHRSKHQDGKALDFFAFVNGKPSWHHPHLAMVAAALLQAGNIVGYPVTWGGLWLPKKPTIIDGIPYGWDCGHIEAIE